MNRKIELKILNIFLIGLLSLSSSSCINPLKNLFKKSGSGAGGSAGYSYPWKECSKGQVNECLSKVMQPIQMSCSGETLDRDDSIVIVPNSNGKKFKKEWITGLWGDLDFYPASALIDGDSKLRDSDLKKLGCTGYKSPNRTHAEKKLFWIFFIASLTRQESGFDSTLSGDDGGTSHGLLQIDYKNGKAHGCDWGGSKSRSVVYKPKENLKCGAKILADQAYRSKCGLLGCHKSAARARNVYFGPLIGTGSGQNKKNVIADFKKHALRQIPWCNPKYNSPFGAVGQQVQKQSCNHVSNISRNAEKKITKMNKVIPHRTQRNNVISN